MNLVYRWFIGYPLNEAVPHFSTVSYNFKHRFNQGAVEYVFRWVRKAAAEEGYLDTEQTVLGKNFFPTFQRTFSPKNRAFLEKVKIKNAPGSGKTEAL